MKLQAFHFSKTSNLSNIFNLSNNYQLSLLKRLIIQHSSKQKIMKTNVGGTDKLIRLVIAVIFVVLYLTGVVSGTLGYVLLGLAVVFVLTALVSFCPLYIPFKINTGKKK